MNDQLEDDWLDARLRDEAPYIDDDGFTAQLVQQLRPQRRRSRSLRAIVLIAVSVLASMLAYVLSGGGTFLVDAAAFLVAMPFASICVLAGMCGLAVMVIGASAAMSKARELRS